MGEILSQGPLFIACLVFMMGIVVIVHEYGHYIVARWFGAAVESFSVGFGKPLLERKDKNGTRWRINMIPFGGFVKFVGEAQTAGDIGVIEEGPTGTAFPKLGVGARSLIALAGPVANFILASLIFALGLWVHGVQNQTILIQGVEAGAPGAIGGIQPGDTVSAINGSPILNTADFQAAIALNPNVGIVMEVLRDGQMVAITVVPHEIEGENAVGQRVKQARIGVEYVWAPAGERIEYNVIEALGGGVVQTGETLNQTVTMLGRIITGKMSVHTMSGPVGIGDISRRIVNRVMEQETTTLRQKINQLFWMQLGICAAISVGIGFFNLLPLPVLDGGHLVFNAYEAVTGKTMPEKVQEASLTFGLILLMGMVIIITWGDIIEAGVFGGSGG